MNRSTTKGELFSSAGGKAETLRILRDAGFIVPAFEMAPDCNEKLREVVERLGLPLAVRSSANCEDGMSTSFAGQFVSYLNLESFEGVQEAVTGCRQAVSSPGVLDYCRRLGIDTSKLQMNVMLH